MTGPGDATAPVIDIADLSTHIKLSRSVVQAVGNVSLAIGAGETLGLVGESGCGKSMTGLSIMRLLPNGGHIVGGSIKLNGLDLVKLSEKQMRDVRGNEVAMIFQDSMTSLNPTMPIGKQIAEQVRRHTTMTKDQAMERAAESLDLVGLPHPHERLDDYPHQLSGGQRQRVIIAIALSCDPKVLIADEPTTALDVTIQAQILGLLDDLKERLGMAVLLITHDMGVVAGRADRVEVMYAGRIVETAPTVELFTHMHHPYTQALLGSIPLLDPGPRPAPVQHPRHPSRPHLPAPGLPFRRPLQPGHGPVPYGRTVPRARRGGPLLRLLAPGGRASGPARGRRRTGAGGLDARARRCRGGRPRGHRGGRGARRRG